MNSPGWIPEPCKFFPNLSVFPQFLQNFQISKPQPYFGFRPPSDDVPVFGFVVSGDG